MTYPDPRVRSQLEEGLVPVRVDVTREPEVAEGFGAARTPTLLVADPEGRVWRRHAGFLPPGELLAELSLARLVEAVERQRYEAAGRWLEAVERWTVEDPERGAEALYYAAMAAYRSTGDRERLSEGWGRLLEEHPDSPWAEKVEFLRP